MSLEQWLPEEETLLERQRAAFPPGGGLGKPADFAPLSGLQQLQLMIDGKSPAPPIAHTLDFWLLEAREGHAVFQGAPQFKHFNPIGSVHGGWFATLLDSALGCAVAAALPAGKAYTTLELKLNIVRALTDKVPLVRAEGRTIHVGGQTATAEARLVGHDGKLYAHATTTCLVFEARPAKG